MGKGNDRSIALRKKQDFFAQQKLTNEFIQKQKSTPTVDPSINYNVSQAMSNDNSQCSGVSASSDTYVSQSFACGSDDPFDKAEDAVMTVRTKVDTGINTAPEGFFVCVYCEMDVPEAIRPLHVNNCVAKYRVILKERKKYLIEEANRLELLAAREKQNRKKRRQRRDVEAKLHADEEKLVADIAAWQAAKELVEPISSSKPRPDAVQSGLNSKASLNPLKKIHANDFDHLVSAARVLDKKQKQCESAEKVQEVQDNAKSDDRSRLKKNLHERLSIMADRRK